MKTSSCKAKGRIWQQAVAAAVRAKFELHEDDVVSRPMGSPGADLMLSPKAQSVLGVTFECKKTTAEPTLAALKQAKANAYPGTIGVVAWQPRGVGGANGVVTLDLQDFLELIAKMPTKLKDMKCNPDKICVHEGSCHKDCGGDHYYYTDGTCLRCGKKENGQG